MRVPITFAAVLIALAITGWVSARLGGFHEGIHGAWLGPLRDDDADRGNGGVLTVQIGLGAFAHGSRDLLHTGRAGVGGHQAASAKMRRRTILPAIRWVLALGALLEARGTPLEHADAGEIMDWLATAPQAPRRTFITHGEPPAADALRQRIERTLGWDCHMPFYTAVFCQGGSLVGTRQQGSSEPMGYGLPIGNDGLRGQLSYAKTAYQLGAEFARQRQ